MRARKQSTSEGRRFHAHLKRIMVGGQVTECVFEGAFATNALTPDHLLLVVAPPLEGVPKLEEPVGVPELGVLAKTLAAARGDDHLVRVEDHRLVVGSVRLLTTEPLNIATIVGPEVVDRLLAKLGPDAVPLPPELVADVRRTFRDLYADRVELVIGPDGGMVRVGREEYGHYAELPLAELRGDPGYELLLGPHFIDVLGVVGDDAVLRLAGPGSLVAVEDEGYKYLLSPRTKSPTTQVAIAPAAAREGVTRQAR